MGLREGTRLAPGHPENLLAGPGVDARPSASTRVSVLHTRRRNFEQHHVLEATGLLGSIGLHTTGAKVPPLHFVSQHVEKI